MSYIFKWFGGRSTFFGLAFFVVGVILAFMGKLTPTYVSLAAALQTMISARSVMDDVHARGMAKLNGNGVDNTAPKG